MAGIVAAVLNLILPQEDKEDVVEVEEPMVPPAAEVIDVEAHPSHHDDDPEKEKRVH